jgi:hypothetical protein
MVFFYNNWFHHNVFEQSHEISYDDKFYEYKKGKDSILVSCITHLRVWSFVDNNKNAKYYFHKKTFLHFNAKIYYERHNPLKDTIEFLQNIST